MSKYISSFAFLRLQANIRFLQRFQYYIVFLGTIFFGIIQEVFIPRRKTQTDAREEMETSSWSSWNTHLWQASKRSGGWKF